MHTHTLTQSFIHIHTYILSYIHTHFQSFAPTHIQIKPFLPYAFFSLWSSLFSAVLTLYLTDSFLNTHLSCTFSHKLSFACAVILFHTRIPTLSHTFSYAYRSHLHVSLTYSYVYQLSHNLKYQILFSYIFSLILSHYTYTLLWSYFPSFK